MKYFKTSGVIFLMVFYLTACMGKDSFDDTDPEFHYQLSLEYLRLGKVSDGIDELKKVIDRDPENIQALSMLGSVYSKMGKSSEAQKTFQEILKIDSKNITALSFLGVLLTQQEKYDKAEGYFEKAAEIAPKDPYVRNNYGLLLFEKEKYDKAIEQYDLALSINPKLYTAKNNKGQALKKKKMYKEALSAFNEVLSVNPKDEMVLSNIGQLYYELGEYKKAIEYHEKVLAQNPKRFFDYYALGEIFFQTGNIEKSEAKYRFALSEKNDFAPALAGLGLLYANKGEKLSYAEEIVTKAIAVDPKNESKYLDTLCWVYYKKGDMKKAGETALLLEEMVNEKGGVLSSRQKFHIGMIYQKQGNKRKGDAYLAEFIEKEKNILRARIAKYGEALMEKDWNRVYQFQSPDFKKQVSSVDYGSRHPEGSEEGMFVTVTIVKYDTGNIQFLNDYKEADVEIVVTRAVKATIVPIPQNQPKEKPVREKWEKRDGIWFRSAIADEVKPPMHISGSLSKG